MRLANYFNEYSKKTKIVKYGHIFLILESIFRRGPKVIRDFFWFVRANKSEEENKLDYLAAYPSIELIITVSGKDLSKLEKCIKFAVANSINKITLTKIIVPAIDFLECQELIKSFNHVGNLQLINEDELISEEIRKLIMLKAKNQYGWILQQVIKVKLALESSSKGILIVDSDTILLGKNLWLDNNGIQRLIAANSKHNAYFKVLKDLGILENRPRYSFVTHHMLIQPEIIKEFFGNTYYTDLYEFLENIFQSKNINLAKDLSIDYELYGQFIYSNFRNRCSLSRFCNLSLESTSPILENTNNEIQKLSSDYNSVSFHSWNQ